MGKSKNAGVIFLTLFGGIFAIAGISAGMTLLPKALRTGNTEELAVAIILPVVFSVAGFGIIGLGQYSNRRANGKERLQNRHPNEPWMWKREWAERRIPGGGKAMVVFSWVFALFWNAIGTPPILFNLPSELSKAKPELFAMALFPFIGFCLLLWAIHTSIYIKPEEDITLRLPALCESSDDQ